jgi:glycosyltransferase involved in cell wall biosynthesis
LLGALREIRFPCTLLIFGEGKLEIPDSTELQVRNLGKLSDDPSLALAYSAADVFVCPSREDNLPNTVAEALACGTPCAAFETGGLPEMIKHHSNGWLARPFDTKMLAEGIHWLCTHPQRETIRESARVSAVRNYNAEDMSKHYALLYEECCARWKTGQANPLNS